MSSVDRLRPDGTTRPIALPQWYARFDAARSPRVGGDDTLQVGPFTVARAESGCEVATGGDPADPTVVIFDGYLFDRRRLRTEFGLASTAPDAEIALAVFERLGPGALDRLDGSYLVAHWNPRERRLILGHDALGHHPVYYAELSGALWFTANVLALPAAGIVDRRPNRVSLAMAALLYWPPAGETFFEKVKRLRPGHYLAVTPNGHWTESFYWTPYLDDDDPGLTAREAWDQFEPTLVGSIDRCMELAPDGIMLSGGLDSVTIAALAAEYAARHHTPLICAISGRRDSPRADEEPMQSATAEALGMRHIVAYESQWQRGQSGVDLSLACAPELPGPSRISWVGAYIEFYRLAVAEGVHVALTGSGGDNWAGIDDSFAAQAMRTFQWRAVARHMASWMGTGGMSLRKAALHMLWSGGVRLILDSHAARHFPSLKRRYHEWRAVSAQPDWLCPDRELKQALGEALYRQRPAALSKEGRVPKNFYRHAPRAQTNPYYQYEYEVAFHIDSSCGLRLLSPYHDKQVVRFLNSIPPEVLLHGDSYKGILRPLAEKRLPNLGLTQQRKAHSTDIEVAHYRELRDPVFAAWPTHSLARLSDLGVIDGPATRRAFAPRVITASDDLVTMYALMSADRWVDARALA